MSDARRMRLAGTTWWIACSLGLLLLGSSGNGCDRKTKPDHDRDTTMTSQSIEQVLETHTDSLMAIRGVEGVGQALCDDVPCIRVYASRMTSEIKSEVPDSIEGYAVDVEVTGPIGPRSSQ